MLRPLDRLPPQDAGYLRRETPSQPLHFVLLARVGTRADSGPLSVDGVRRHVAGRLHRLPELRRLVKHPPFGVGAPVWVDDASFDIDRHVVGWDLATPDEDGVRHGLGDLAALHVPTTRPLWRLHVGPRLADGTAPIALAVHHALMDGGLLAGVLQELFGPAETDAASDWVPPRPPTAARLLAEGLLDAARHRVRRLRSRAVAPTRAPSRSRGGGGLTGRVGARRRVTWITVPLSELRRLRTATAATINDLFLAAVADGVQTLLDGRGETVPGAQILALVPRDVRTADEARAVGNRTWSMLVPLPVAETDAARRLAAVKAAATAAKAQARSSGSADHAYDIAISNVRFGGGHAVAGQPILSYLATGPLQGTNRLIAVGSSYEDTFVIAFTADADVFDDLDELAAATARGIVALSDTVAAGQPDAC